MPCSATQCHTVSTQSQTCSTPFTYLLLQSLLVLCCNTLTLSLSLSSCPLPCMHLHRVSLVWGSILSSTPLLRVCTDNSILLEWVYTLASTAQALALGFLPGSPLVHSHLCCPGLGLGGVSLWITPGPLSLLLPRPWPWGVSPMDHPWPTLPSAVLALALGFLCWIATGLSKQFPLFLSLSTPPAYLFSLLLD